MKVQQINSDAPVKCSKCIEINAPIEKVWSIMADIDNWSKWQPTISRPSLSGQLKMGSRFTWKTGGAGITSTLQTVNHPTHLSWTGKTYGMFAIHNWTFERIPYGTLVSVDESMEGLLAFLFKKAFNRNLEKDMANWLSCLKKEAEKTL